MNCLLFLFAVVLLDMAHGQVDPGGGTFSCLPCARQECYLSNSNHLLTVPGLGTQTCAHFQKAAEDRTLFPDECADIQTQTLATSDPCICKQHDGSDCPPPGFTNTQACNLCGVENQRIGDPHMVIKSGLLIGVECIDAFDLNALGAFANSNCPAASQSIQDWCSCAGPGEIVEQCIPQEDSDFPCDPNNPTDACCVGQCNFRLSEFEFVCTTKDAEPVHPTYTPPAPSLPAPIPSPFFLWQPIPLPTDGGFFQTPPGTDECDPLEGCDSSAMRCALLGGQYASYKCISKSTSGKDSYSLSSGGGAGASAKANSGG